MWEYLLKYKIRNFSKKFSKEAARSKKIESSTLEMKLKILRSQICHRDNPEYIHCKEELEKLCQGKINGAIIRSRCNWYEHREKLSKFFLDLEKNCAVQNQLRTISCSEKEITDEKEINTELFKFYKMLFEPKINISNALIQEYLNHIEMPKLTKEQSQKCERVITEGELLKALKEMSNNKLPGNNRISKDFHETFLG